MLIAAFVGADTAFDRNCGLGFRIPKSGRSLTIRTCFRALLRDHV